MKQILEKSDIEDAISEYLASRGFSVEKLRIRFSFTSEGAPVPVTDTTEINAEVSGLILAKPRAVQPTPVAIFPPGPVQSATLERTPTAPRIDPRTIPLPSPKTGKITGLPPEAQGLTPEQIQFIAEGGELALASAPFTGRPNPPTEESEMSEVEVADTLEELGILPDQVDPRELGPPLRSGFREGI